MATPLNYTRNIQPGSSVEIKLQLFGLGSPQLCTINGEDCGYETPPATGDVPPVTGLNVGTSTTSATLTWGGPDHGGPIHYEVSVDGLVAHVTGSESATITSLPPDRQFTFDVVDVDGAGNRSQATSTTASTALITGGMQVNVSTPAQLKQAIIDAQPGTQIRLAPGTYEGSFVATTSGTAEQPIVLSGPSSAVLEADGES